MEDRSAHAPWRWRFRRATRWGVVAFLSLMIVTGWFGAGGVRVALVGGCTVTPENYATLSLFFDGVPDPHAGSAESPTSPGAPGTATWASVHKPYAEEKCEVCHKGRLRLGRNDSGVCAQCHEDVGAKHTFVHGPVGAGACLWCHMPHESRHPSLLRDTARKVCLQCHRVTEFDAVPVPEHRDETRACLECHSGHGGGTRYFLKAGGMGGGTGAGVSVEGTK